MIWVKIVNGRNVYLEKVGSDQRTMYMNSFYDSAKTDLKEREKLYHVSLEYSVPLEVCE